MITLPQQNSNANFYHFGFNYVHYLTFCKDELSPILNDKIPQSISLATSPFKDSKRVKLWKRQIVRNGYILYMITIAQGEFSVIDPCFATLEHFFPGKTTLYFRFNY
jgi:hypothetical protein